MSSYYNTTSQTGQRLLEFCGKAKTQDNRIYEFLVKHEFHWFSPESLRLLIFGEKTPITSVRRSLTSLTEQGKIEKSPTANALSEFNRPTHTWRFKP